MGGYCASGTGARWLQLRYVTGLVMLGEPRPPGQDTVEAAIKGGSETMESRSEAGKRDTASACGCG